MTHEETENQQRIEELEEAKRLLKILNKKQALFFCEEMAKKLPNINNTPPIHRIERKNYMQFYLNGVSSAIEKIYSPKN